MPAAASQWERSRPLHPSYPRCHLESCRRRRADCRVGCRRQAVSELLAEANAAMSSGEDEKAKAEAQIKVEVLTAMQAATA
eukprot:COSAG01_NODE_3074_length_6634_cov_172.624484_5_plen_81_part_00